MKRVRIVNDSINGKFTSITDADTGEQLTDITHVEITFGCNDIIKAKLTHVLPIVDLIALVDE